MVDFEEVNDNEPMTANTTENVQEEDVEMMEPPSQERLLDADAIEKLAESIVDRPSARAHLQVLITRLRREGAALKRVEASKAIAKEDSNNAKQPPKREQASSSAVSSTAALTSKYIPIDKFSFDMGGYNSQFVTLYISLPSVGSIPKSQITCNFQEAFFDLIVNDLNGKSYRLYKDNLEHDIDPKASKIIVKSDKVIVKLGKQKKEYGGYDMWTELNSKKAKKIGPDGKSEKEDPTSSIMDLMKDLYDKGDDNMKKMIGETMLKQRQGQLDKPDFKTPDFGDL